MPRNITTLSNGNRVYYDTGRFDDWCVYIKYTNGEVEAPIDTKYFFFLKKLNEIYGDSVYQDFVQLFERTSTTIDKKVLQFIVELSKQYNKRPTHPAKVEQWLTVLYAGMVAEENVTYTKLGKRIKRLGVYQVLVEGMQPEVAANFSRGKSWRVLDKEMKKRGF